MSRSDAEELLALEAQGVEMSRNQHFELFEQDGPRRALRLWRRINGLARFVRRYRESPDFEVRVEEVAGRWPLAVRIHLHVLSATLTACLDCDEVKLLARDADMAAVLRQAGFDPLR
jgi:hypothetical protein